MSDGHDDEIAAIVRDFEAASAAIVGRLRALQARAPIDGEARPRDDGLEFVAVSVAAFDSGISESRLRLLCKFNPLDAPGGFALRKGGRWLVHQRRYRAFCAAYPRKGRCKR